MLFQEALKHSKSGYIKRPFVTLGVEQDYIEQYFNTSNPYTEDEFIEEFGYYQELSFYDLMSDDWQSID